MGVHESLVDAPIGVTGADSAIVCSVCQSAAAGRRWSGWSGLVSSTTTSAPSPSSRSRSSRIWRGSRRRAAVASGDVVWRGSCLDPRGEARGRLAQRGRGPGEEAQGVLESVAPGVHGMPGVAESRRSSDGGFAPCLRPTAGDAGWRTGAGPVATSWKRTWSPSKERLGSVQARVMTVRNSSVMRPRSANEHAEGTELVLRPADADTEHEAACGELVEVGAHAGGQERMPVGEDGDARPEREPGRERGQPRQRRERVVERAG